MLKQCTDTFRDSHDATRHKSRRTPRSTVRPDEERHSNICSELRMCRLLCMFGESVFALIPDHEVRAAKLTNRWISGSWWGRDASSDERLVGTKHGLLKCRSVRRKPPGEQWSRRETVEARRTKWNFDVEMDSGISGPPVASRRDEVTATATATETTTATEPPPQPDSHVPEMRG